MNDHIAKPIDPGLLFDTVARHCAPREASSPAVTPPKASEAPAIDLGDVESLDGLDVRDGLGRVAGNRKLYVKLLRQFAEQQGPAGAQIADALAQDDASTAERLAHTVKGVAGNLGAGDVQSAAAALEKAIAAGAAPDARAPIQDVFTATLVEFVARLRAALPEVDVPVSSAVDDVAIDPAHVRAVVAEMLTHLRNFDAGAGDLIEAQEPVFRFVFAPDGQTEFAEHVGGYAFDEALALLEQAAKDKGVLST